MPDTEQLLADLEARARVAAQSGRHKEAECLCLKMRDADPALAKPYLFLSDMYLMQHRYEDAVTLLSAPGVPLDDNALLTARLGYSLNRTGRTQVALSVLKKAAHAFPEDLRHASRYLFKLMYRPEFDAHDFLRQAEELCAVYRPPHVELAPPADAPPLRVGFVTGNLHRHPVTVFFLPIFHALDRRRILPFIYSVGPADKMVVQSIQERGNACVDLSGMGEQEAAERIRDDRLHILCDLDGHVGNNRLGISARKPAPVQFTWIGAPCTTGLPEMDCLMLGTDECGPDAQSVYSEQLVCMEHGFAPFAFMGKMPEVGSLPCLSGAPFTFASFNFQPKHGPETYELWAEILSAVPGSRLFMKNPSLQEEGVRVRVLEDLKSCGIPDPRVVMAGRTTRFDHLKAYNLVDIALDPIAYSGSTTTCEALSMGVPVLTLPGNCYHHRHSLSFLKGVGLTEWIAESREDYVRRAVKFAQDKMVLADLRQGLRRRFLASPVCDVRGFTRKFEQELAAMAGIEFHENPPEPAPSVPSMPHPEKMHSALAFALTSRGVEAAGRDKFTEAEGCLIQALCHDPEWLPARVNLVRVMIRNGKVQEAEEWYKPLEQARLDTEQWPGIDEAVQEIRHVLEKKLKQQSKADPARRNNSE